MTGWKTWHQGVLWERLAEVGVVIASVAYLVSTDNWWAMLVWEALAAFYVTMGFLVAWDDSEPPVSREEARLIAWFSWIMPLVASFAGVNSAVIALITRNEKSFEASLVSVVAALGVMLSWSLLHMGFAQIYQSLDAEQGHTTLNFPGKAGHYFINYLYFAFTVGTSFATSDVNVLTIRMRRLVLVHSIVSFFYNALVVAIAIQILQNVLAK